MKKTTLIACITSAVITLNMPGLAEDAGSDEDGEYGSPERFEAEILRFEAEDQKHPPAEGAIVCVGSSSMLRWHETIRQDLAPLTVIPRGFGGSNMNDALHYADRIVLPYKPRAIVIYEGENDIAQGISPDKVRITFRMFAAKVHGRLPQCRIYVLSAKPSTDRWHLWDRMKAANSLLAAECAKDERLTFVDVASSMLSEGGEPRDIFVEDNLHMSRKGYVIWRDILQPILVKSELRFEKQSTADTGKAEGERPAES